MAADRRIICTNEDGASIELNERGFLPFLLMSVEGVYQVSNNLAYSERASISGADYLGSVKPPRNIILTFKDNADDHYTNRDYLDEIFKDNVPGTLEFIEGEHDRRIDYYVESMDSNGMYGSRVYTVSLMCMDPFFYNAADVNVDLSEYNGNFEFPHEFVSTGEEIGSKSMLVSKEFDNLNAFDGVGMTIVLKATDEITNPKIIHLETGTFIQLGYEGKDFVMSAGDIVTITTQVGNKHIYLEHEGVKTEINQYMSEDSEFILLKRGKNTIKYEIEEDDALLDVTISYRMMYARA